MYTGTIKRGDGSLTLINGTEPSDLDGHLASRESREKMKDMIGKTGARARKPRRQATI